ncbi:MAG: HRDC domain-containing protein [Planctomycetes bacterium]|nr:HRDC domain-containing protein [Planctomycetota bacterium]
MESKRSRKSSSPRAKERELVYVDENRQLRRLIEHCRRQPALAVDTEANPMFAYRERLCLLQISSRSRDYIVDPLADVDIGLLAEIFADVGIVKVLHGAEFDVLQLKRAWPFEIRGLFDTRVAAASLGFDAPSLAAVLREWLDVEVDKAHQRSDWGKRPLSAGQLEYARDDTRYLIELSNLLRAELHEAGPPHMDEVAAECRRVEAMCPEPRDDDKNDWIRIKGATALDPIGHRVLRDLNRLRHRIAEERDRPLFKVFGNDVLLKLAKAKPVNLDQLRRSNALTPRLLGRYGRDLVDVIAAAKEKGPLKRLPSTRRHREEQLRGEQRELYEAIRAFRKNVAERRQTDASLVMSKQLMMELAKCRPLPTTFDKLADSKLLEPWRLAEYGDELARAIARASGES